MGEENARLCEHAAVCLLFLSGNDCWLTASYATAPEKQLCPGLAVCVTLDLSQSLSPSLSPPSSPFHNAQCVVTSVSWSPPDREVFEVNGHTSLETVLNVSP